MTGPATLLGTGPHGGGNTLSATQYCPINGGRNPAESGGLTVESSVRTTIRTAGTLSNLYETHVTSTTQNITYAIVQNGTTTALSLLISANTTGTFSDNADTVTVASGDTLSVSCAAAASCVCPKVGGVALQFAATSNSSQMMGSQGTTNVTSVSTALLFGLVGVISTVTGSTHTDADMQFPVVGTLSNLAANVSLNAKAVTTTFVLLKAGVAVNQTFSVSASTTGYFEDTTHSDSVADTTTGWCVQLNASASGNYKVEGICCKFDASTLPQAFTASGKSIDGETLTANMTVYLSTFGGGSANYSTDLVNNVFPFPVQTSNYGVQINNANTVTAASTLALRKNQGAANQSVSVTASTTGWFIDSTDKDYFAVGDVASTQAILGATGTSLQLQTTVLRFDTAFVPAVHSLSLTSYAPVVGYNIKSLGVGSVAFTGYAQSSGPIILPVTGSLTLTGNASTVGRGQVAGVGNLTLTGLAPSLNRNIALVTGSLVLGQADAPVQDYGSLPLAGTLALQPNASSLDRNIAGNVGALTLTGRAPRVDTGVSPATDALILTLAAPTPDIGIPANAGALSLFGYAPAFVQDFPRAMPVGAAVLTGYTPVADSGISCPAGAVALLLPFSVSVSANTGIQIGLGLATLALAGYVPGVSFNVAMPAGAASLTSYAATTAIDTSPAMTTGTVTLTGNADTVGPGVQLFPGTGALALVGKAPVVDIGVRPQAGALALVGQSALLGFGFVGAAGAASLVGRVLVADSGLAVPVGGLSLTGANVTLADNWAVPAGSMAFTGLAAFADTGIPGNAGSLGMSGNAPFLGKDVSGSTGALAFAGFAPVADTGPGMATQALALTGNAVALGDNCIIDIGSVQLSGYPPLSDNAVLMAVGSMALVSHAIALDSNLGTSPGMVVLTGRAPSVGTGIMTTGQLALSGHASTPDTGLAPQTGSLTLSGPAPAYAFDHPRFPVTGTVLASGQSVSLGLNVTSPNAASVVLTGNPPSVDTGIVPLHAGILSFSDPPVPVGQGIGIATGTLAVPGYVPDVTIFTLLFAGTLVLASDKPTPSLGQTDTTATGSVQLSGNPPSLGFTVSPPAGVMVVVGPAKPDVDRGVLEAVGSLSLASTPLVRVQTLSVDLATGRAALAGYVPGIAAQYPAPPDRYVAIVPRGQFVGVEG